MSEQPISRDLRATLERHGFIKLPTTPKPPAPRLDTLVKRAREKEWGISLTVPEDPRAAVFADVADGQGGSGSGEHSSAGVALALAIVDLLRQTEG